MAEEKADTTEETTEGADSPVVAKPMILGRKLGMMQMFKEDGSAVAVTVIATEQNLITRVATKERDGYAAVQIGFGAVADKKMTKPERGHLKGLPNLKYLREVRLDDVAGFAVGQKVNVGSFTPGDKVHVIGTSKGKGFSGPIHLHHFSRGPKSHGSDHLRRQGSVGAGTTPGRVLKGMRMAARQGFDRVTVKNLEVLRADGERSLLVLSGAVPGPKNSIVMVRKA